MKNIIPIVFLLVISAFSGMSQDIKRISIRANDVLYNEAIDRLYLSTKSGGENGNSICIMDPYFGSIDTCIFIGSEPGPLAISTDARLLYVGFQESPIIVVLQLDSLKIDQEFNLGSDPFFGPLYAEDIEIVPGQEAVLAVSLYRTTASPRHAGVAIFDHGVRRNQITQDHTGSNSIVFHENGELFGYNNETSEFGLRHLLIDDNGISEGQVYPNFFEGYGLRLKSDDGFIYTSHGEMAKVMAMMPIRTGKLDLGAVIFGGDVQVAPDTNLIYHLGGQALKIFNKTTFNFIDEVLLDFNIDYVRELIHWGEGLRLAAVTDSEAIIIRNCVSTIQEPIQLNKSVEGGCEGEAVLLKAPEGYLQYIWSNGMTGREIEVTMPGFYTYQAMDNMGCLSFASNPLEIVFEFKPPAPFIQSPPNITICQNQEISLTVFGDFPIERYVWNTGDTTQTLTVREAGAYRVQGITALGCATDFSGAVQVMESDDVLPEQPVILVDGDSVLCEGEMTTLVAPEGFAFYLWNNGQNTGSITVHSGGLYTVIVGNNDSCPSPESEGIEITIFPDPDKPTIQANGNLLASSSPEGNQWFLNGELIAGAINQFYKAESNGFYSVQVTINGCSSELSDLYNHVLTSSKEVEESKIKIYPNPSTQVLNIQSFEDERLSKIQVYDLSGKRIMDIPYTKQLDVTYLKPGIYVLTLLDHQGSLVYIDKIYKASETR